jgi:ATP-dependent RNA helicase SUPV3L1/SUV3
VPSETVAADAGAEKASAEATPDGKEPEAAVQYWRWKGMARKKNQSQFKPREKHQKKGKGAPVKRKAEPVLATAGGAFAELAALRDSMKK